MKKDPRSIPIPSPEYVKREPKEEPSSDVNTHHIHASASPSKRIKVERTALASTLAPRPPCLPTAEPLSLRKNDEKHKSASPELSMRYPRCLCALTANEQPRAHATPLTGKYTEQKSCQAHVAQNISFKTPPLTEKNDNRQVALLMSTSKLKPDVLHRSEKQLMLVTHVPLVPSKVHRTRAATAPVPQPTPIPTFFHDFEGSLKLCFDFGMVVIERNANTNEAEWIGCRFCPVFGCKSRREKYIMAQKKPFNIEKLAMHLTSEHPMMWPKYHDANNEGKMKIFEKMRLPKRDYFVKRVMELKSGMGILTEEERQLWRELIEREKDKKQKITQAQREGVD